MPCESGMCLFRAPVGSVSRFGRRDDRRPVSVLTADRTSVNSTSLVYQRLSDYSEEARSEVVSM
jgi:hypothetical protein